MLGTIHPLFHTQEYCGKCQAVAKSVTRAIMEGRSLRGSHHTLLAEGCLREVPVFAVGCQWLHAQASVHLAENRVLALHMVLCNNYHRCCHQTGQGSRKPRLLINYMGGTRRNASSRMRETHVCASWQRWVNEIDRCGMNAAHVALAGSRLMASAGPDLSQA